MNMDRIDIAITEDRAFGDIAFLVDKPKFLESLYRLRNKWAIRELLPASKLKDWKQNLFDRSMENMTDFEIDIRDLRIRFNKPETFDNAIAYALVCGVIPNEVYKSTYSGIEPQVSPARLDDRTTRVAIYITPQSTEEDVLRVFKAIKKNYFKDKGDGYAPFFSLKHKRGESTIKRDRGLYWRNIGGESPLSIAVRDNKGVNFYSKAKKAIKTHPHDKEYDKYLNAVEDYSKMVEQAIRRYKQALTYT